MTDLFDQLAEEATDATAIPDDQKTAQLREKAEELVSLDSTISDLERQLEERKAERKELAMKELPDFMLEMGTDHIGVASAGVDVVLEAYYHANISKEWEDDRRRAAFDHLDELGAGDIIRSIITISAGKEEIEGMRKLLELLGPMLEELGVSAKTDLEMTVPWNTLTAFVKEQTKKGTALDLEKLGATVGNIVKIKKRKD